MQINSKVIPFMPRKKSGLGGLGFDPFSFAATLATTALKPSGGSGSAAPVPVAAPITVSPTIQTAISPQISPVFQQAFQPSGSPMTAGTTQMMPTTQSAAPDAGGVPGFATGMPTASGVPDSGLTPVGVPGGVFTQGKKTFLQEYGMYLAVGGGLILLAMVARKRRGSDSRQLRVIG